MECKRTARGLAAQVPCITRASATRPHKETKSMNRPLAPVACRLQRPWPSADNIKCRRMPENLGTLALHSGSCHDAGPRRLFLDRRRWSVLLSSVVCVVCVCNNTPLARSVHLSATSRSSRPREIAAHLHMAAAHSSCALPPPLQKKFRGVDPRGPRRADND